MKKQFFFALAAVLLAACSSEIEEPQSNEVEVKLHFSNFQLNQEPITRSATSVSDYATKLDIWISDGTTTTPYQQEVGQNGFGSLSLTLNNQKEYTLYAVAHRVSSGHATLADGIISFPDDKVTHTFFVSRKFTPLHSLTTNT